MDIQREIDVFLNTNRNEDYDKIKEKLGRDDCKKIGAILDILEIGESSVARAKLLLRVCEDVIEKFSPLFGTKMDAQ